MSSNVNPDVQIFLGSVGAVILVLFFCIGMITHCTRENAKTYTDAEKHKVSVYSDAAVKIAETVFTSEEE